MNVQSLRGYERVAQNDSDAMAPQRGEEDGEAYSQIGVQIEEMERQLQPGVQQPGASNFLVAAAATARDGLQSVAARLGDIEIQPLRLYTGAAFSLFSGAVAASTFGPAGGFAFSAASALITASGLSDDEDPHSANLLYELGGQVTGMLTGMFLADSGGWAAVGGIAGQLTVRGVAYFSTRDAGDAGDAGDAEEVAHAGENQHGVALQH